MYVHKNLDSEINAMVRNENANRVSNIFAYFFRDFFDTV